MRAYSLFVLTLEGKQISAITWFADGGLCPQLGLQRMLQRKAGQRLAVERPALAIARRIANQHNGGGHVVNLDDQV